MAMWNSTRVKKVRKQRGLNQTDFWRKIGFTQSSGSRREDGSRKMDKRTQLLLTIAYGPAGERDSVIYRLTSRP